MPSLVPLVLTVATVPYTYGPIANRNNKAILSDKTTKTRVVEQSVITSEVTPATNSKGSKTLVVLKLPIPVTTQEGCCVDTNSPEAIYYNISVAIPNSAAAADRDLALELLRQLVGTTTFAAWASGEASFG